MATIDFYPIANGDGAVRRTQDASPQTWDFIHDVASGDVVDATDNQAVLFIDWDSAAGGNYNISRFFFPFDTSSIPNGATITVATLTLTAAANGTVNDTFSVGIVQTTAANTNALVLADYSECGAVDNPTEGATRLPSSDFDTTDETNTFTLNATGRGWINKTGVTQLGLRTSNDMDDSAPTVGLNRLEFYLVEITGAKRPKLTVTYTNDQTLVMALGTFALTGIAVVLVKAISLAMALGTFTLTGIATIFNFGRTLVMAVGSFALTGIAVALINGKLLVMAVGSFTLTGIAVAFKKTVTLIMAVGSFVLTGISAILNKGFTIILGVGTFILSGLSVLFGGWLKEEKSTSSWDKISKNSASWSEKSTSSSSWTKKTKST